jgi:hypothetical protein
VSARRLAPLALLLALAACAPARLPLDAPEPERPEVAACREEGRRESRTRETFREINPGNLANAARIERERAELAEQAFRECLRRNGIAGGGGVERVQLRR